MSADLFLDTNVIVYAFHSDAPEKQRQAKKILAKDDWFVSWQVIQEFSSVALQKFAIPLRPDDLNDYVALKLWPRCRILPSRAVFAKAIQIHERFHFRYYDSLIVAAALAGEARRLLSEDLQTGQKIAGLDIQSPF